MRFEVDAIGERETYIYCYPVEPTEDTFAITERAGNIVTDALVDAGVSLLRHGRVNEQPLVQRNGPVRSRPAMRRSKRPESLLQT